MAREFGVEAHLGDYRWYSKERFETELPCVDPIVTGCADVDYTISSDHLPLVHEIAHLVQLEATGEFCPAPLAEGLAEYYSTGSTWDVGEDGLERVVAAFDDPTADVHWSSYGPLGRFAAFLVTRLGLDTVLDVCRTTGRYPSAEALSAAMEAVLGSTRAQLLAEFEAELGPACDQAREFESPVYACGAAEAAADAGLVGEDKVELRYAIDCANERTVGPFGERVWIIERFDLEVDGTVFFWMDSEDADISEVTLTLASCEPCGEDIVIQGDLFADWSFDAGRYWLEVNAPADFVGTVTVHLNP